MSFMPNDPGFDSLANLAAPVPIDELNQEQAKALQHALLALGYPVGPIDGLVGRRTRSAWAEFCADSKMGRPDSVEKASVSALGAALQPRVDANGFDFGSKQGTVDAIAAECKRQGIGLREQIAYVLATVQHETNGSFRPVEEAYYLGAHADSYRKNLRYYRYYGRGFVQLTWDYNYKTYSLLTGKDLLTDPELALDPAVATFVLVDGFKFGRFTGRKITDYITASGADFRNARRCINGLDRADDIAAIAKNFVTTL